MGLIFKEKQGPDNGKTNKQKTGELLYLKFKKSRQALPGAHVCTE